MGLLLLQRDRALSARRMRLVGVVAALALLCGVLPVDRPIAVGTGSGSLVEALAGVARGVDVSVHAAMADGADVVGGAVHAAADGARAAGRGTRSLLTRAVAGLATASAGLGVGWSRAASASDGNASGPTFGLAAIQAFAGNGTNATVDNSTGTSAEFKAMGGVVVVGSYAYVGTVGAIRQVNLSSGAVTTLAGSATATGCTDSATASSVRFGSIVDVATDGTYLYASQPDCSGGWTFLIRKVNISTGATTTLTTAPDPFTYSGYLTYSGGYLFVSGSSILKINVSTTPDTSSTLASLTYKGKAIVGDGTYLWVSAQNGASSYIYKVTL